MKKSKKLGKNILGAEIQHISKHGLWLYMADKEFFVPFKAYPWFLKATIEQIYNFSLLHGSHLYWPALDVDIDVKALENPDAYPLAYNP